MQLLSGDENGFEDAKLGLISLQDRAS
jgi:hypothetical protein